MKTTTPKCPECGKCYLEPATTTLTGATHGERFDIITDALCCPNCGFKTIPTETMGQFALRVADAYRQKHGLLTSSQIKDRRLDLGMSQQQFASYLGVGSSSIKRWELGSIQDKAMNDLILLKTDPRQAEANLAEVQTRLSGPRWPPVFVDTVWTEPRPGVGVIWEIVDSPAYLSRYAWTRQCPAAQQPELAGANNRELTSCSELVA